MRRALALAVLLVAGCSRAEPVAESNAAAPTGLEAAAIEAGVIADPKSADITGLYTRETDRVCIVPTPKAYQIGVFVDYGDQQHCSGLGSVTRAGETLHLDFSDADGCAFDARFEGDRIVFPGSVPEACRKLCSERASIAGLAVDQLSDAASEAATLRDSRGRLLCPSR
ncbi:hypothetical protein AWL63_13930 [Sphingomonas panacis]|uniref:Beta/gamma crystallin 'Greek key' domain-containing protein n=1 Tax=Sphingomonas panacis TaxID=1560345 RepID=A0A1B3ZBT8_9SPHN|nr:hypothetical protein [Sphingomonas panacis]AOH84894.1 hypothetical protein AWL63_13930 [Sphingomonas panacis]